MKNNIFKKIAHLLLLDPIRNNRQRKRNRINKRLREKLINHTPSIIGDNCNVGVIYHDLGLQFRSPTINLYILPDDYIKFLSNLKYYVSHDVVETHEEGIDYPIGLIDDIKVYFMHYSSFDEAKSKWIERCSRIDYDNLFVMMTQREAICTEKHVRAFDALPYRDKVIFTNHPYRECKSSFYIRGFEKQEGVPLLLDFEPPKFMAKRYLDRFDIVGFLNRTGEY